MPAYTREERPERGPEPLDERKSAILRTLRPVTSSDANGMRRFTRLTNGFSKKLEFHAHAVSLNFMYYNFARNHQSLRIQRPDGSYAQRTPRWQLEWPDTGGRWNRSLGFSTD